MLSIAPNKVTLTKDLTLSLLKGGAAHWLLAAIPQSRRYAVDRHVNALVHRFTGVAGAAPAHQIHL